MTPAIMHRQRVLETISDLVGTQTAELTRLLDAPRRLAVDVVSPIDVPGFDNSSMDGYALAASTLRDAAQVRDPDAGSPDDPSASESSGGRAVAVFGPIPVHGRVAAGARGTEVAPGTAVEIMTGAPLPPGTDTIVAIEATRPGEFESPEITVSLSDVGSGPHPGTFVRPRGSDVTSGTTVLRAGTMLTPAHLGVAAACGIRELEVHALPRVLVVSTGDEITADAAAGIHDANAITLSASLRRLGVEVRTLAIPDDPQLLLDRVAAAEADLIISTGGISKGAHEVVKLASELDPDSAMVFEPIAMQPGGPQGCGTLAGRRWIALPGNPVSALLSFEMFVRPALLGLDVDEDPREVEFHRLVDGLDETPPSGKLQVRRAIMTERGLELLGGSRSHLLHNYAQSTHLVFIPPTDPMPSPDDPFSGSGDRVRTWKIA